MTWWGLSSGFWQSLILASVLIAILPAWRKWRTAGDAETMTWMDWCGYFCLRGIVLALMGGLLDSTVLMATGVWLMCGLYPIAVLGLLGKLDDFRVTVVKAYRNR